MKKTREKIVTAACQLFLERGFSEVGVDVIAKHSGITRQTLYNHFESKDEMILEVIMRRDQWWRETLRDRIRDFGSDPERQLRNICGVIVEMFTSNPLDGRLFVCAATTFPSPEDPIHCAAKDNVDAIGNIIEKIAARAGVLDPKKFAELFNTIIEGTITLDVINGHNAKATSVEAAFVLTNMLIEKHLRFYRSGSRLSESCRAEAAVLIDRFG